LSKIEELLPPLPKPKPKYKIERYRLDLIFNKEEVAKSMAKFLRKKEGVLNLETTKRGTYFQVTLKVTEEFLIKTVLTNIDKITSHPNFTLLSITDLFKLKVG